MSEIEVFLQGAGIGKACLIRLPEGARVRELVEVARQHGLELADGEAAIVLLEDEDEPLSPEASLAEAGLKHRGRVHVHRCRRVEATVNFNGQTATHPFSPAQPLRRVKAWAVKQFGLSEVDAAEHALQLCNSTDRPPEDTHVGALVTRPGCRVCFDLVPKQRIEGC